MRAALLDEPGAPFRLADIARPAPRAGDVVVRVRACGVVPNLRNIVGSKTWRILPRMPAVFGLDTAGEVAEVGDGVHGIAVGDRVYVNPALYCGSCHYCRRGLPLYCEIGALQGYFGFRPGAEALLNAWPHGGFCEYVTAPAANLVKLPDDVSFEIGARFGYLGTAYGALETGAARAGDTLAIVGGTGTLGVHAVLFGLALGLSRIVPIARNPERLARIRALAPDRIRPVAIDGTPIAPRIRQATDGIGADLIIDGLARGTPSNHTADALMGLRRGGMAVNIGALGEELPIPPMAFMVNALGYRGSNWFTVAQGERMASLFAAGLIDLSVFETRAYPLERINDAIADVASNNGGFVNIVVVP